MKRVIVHPHFQNQRVLITGASSGIGRAFAHRIARDGGDLVLVARRGEVLERLAEEIRSQTGADVQCVPADLSTPGAADALVQTLRGRDLVIDGLINNAGLGLHGDLGASDPALASTQIAVNVTALTELTARLLPGMLSRRTGTIINIASTAAFQPVPHMAVYAATKSYVLSFSRALWEETRGTGVRVLAVCPGATDTAFFDVAGENASVGKRRTPENVVHAALKALRSDRPDIVDGTANSLLAALAARMPSRFAIALAERSVRPAAPLPKSA